MRTPNRVRFTRTRWLISLLPGIVFNLLAYTLGGVSQSVRADTGEGAMIVAMMVVLTAILAVIVYFGTEQLARLMRYKPGTFFLAALACASVPVVLFIFATAGVMADAAIGVVLISVPGALAWEVVAFFERRAAPHEDADLPEVFS